MTTELVARKNSLGYEVYSIVNGVEELMGVASGAQVGSVSGHFKYRGMALDLHPNKVLTIKHALSSIRFFVNYVDTQKSTERFYSRKQS